ncbi:unnamed protein product [Lampetra planeri]
MGPRLRWKRSWKGRRERERGACRDARSEPHREPDGERQTERGRDNTWIRDAPACWASPPPSKPPQQQQQQSPKARGL